MLEYLFPNASIRIDEALRSQLRSANGKAKGRTRRSLDLGRSVGQLAVEHGMSDGSNAVFTGTIPSGPGIWNGTDPPRR